MARLRSTRTSTGHFIPTYTKATSTLQHTDSTTQCLTLPRHTHNTPQTGKECCVPHRPPSYVVLNHSKGQRKAESATEPWPHRYYR